MACTLSASGSGLLFKKYQNWQTKERQYSLRLRASSPESEDCNDEECAPDKEVIIQSFNSNQCWKSEHGMASWGKTRVVGTFPPKKRGWTGYVEKDTAGQTNIYSVEPAVYVAESAFSSGTAGSSSDGAENTAAIGAGLALIAIAAASPVVLQVGKNTPAVVQAVETYSGPSLNYYINKFKPAEIIETSAPEVTESQMTSETEASVPEVSEPEVRAESQPEIAPSVEPV